MCHQGTIGNDEDDTNMDIFASVYACRPNIYSIYPRSAVLYTVYDILTCLGCGQLCSIGGIGCAARLSYVEVLPTPHLIRVQNRLYWGYSDT